MDYSHGRVIVRRCWVTGILLLALLLAACGGGPGPVRAILQVDGPQGAAALVRYHLPGAEEQQEQVTLPWKLEVQYTVGQPLELVADNTSRAGNISCTILFEGQATPAKTAEDVDQALCKLP